MSRRLSRSMKSALDLPRRSNAVRGLDYSVRFLLEWAFPHLPEALAGPGATVPAIMPERLTSTSPYQPVKEVVASGPYRFLPDPRRPRRFRALCRIPAAGWPAWLYVRS